MNYILGLGWAFTAFMVFVPLNWIRLWTFGEDAHGATMSQFIAGTFICWGIAGAIGSFLIISVRRSKKRKAQEEKETEEELERLFATPLTEIVPSIAILKPGEKAYCAIAAGLQETKTIGFSGSSRGVSVRVVKGLTLRSGGSRSRAVKGSVIVSTGELVITDKRVIFSGNRKSFSISHDGLIGSTSDSEGFSFSNNKTTYSIIASNKKDRLRFAVALHILLRGRE